VQVNESVGIVHIAHILWRIKFLHFSWEAFYGKSGEIATNRLEDQEVAVLSLHLLQACLVYINTLMLQQILTEPGWLDRMAAEDFRALSPLVYHHVNPYGTFALDLEKRIPIEPVTPGQAA
jgi:Tn3 transposase DDE domain